MSPRQTIAVIDDDDSVRDSLRALLETQGFTVVDFSSGHDFFCHRDGAKPACLIVDVHMPHMTGIEMLKSLRAAGDRTPAILVSSRRDAAMQAQATALETPLLDKPLPRGALIAAIQQATTAV